MSSAILNQKDMMNMFTSLALDNIQQAQSPVACAEPKAFSEASYAADTYAKNASQGAYAS